MAHKYWCHHTKFENLESNTQYYYQFNEYSSKYSFRTRLLGLSGNPHFNFSSLIVGDLGSTKNSDNTRYRLEQKFHQSHLLLHVGDIAYADDAFQKHTGYETNWELYFERMKDILPYIPYMVLPGNHEASCQQVMPRLCHKNRKNFTQYLNRFQMPYVSSNGTSNMWYSFNYGNAHFVSINTETNFPNAPEGITSRFKFGNFTQNQLEWLENDLKAANANREIRPWLIVMGHRPMYCRNTPTEQHVRSAFEELFLKHHVDVYVAGHLHRYERVSPMKRSNQIDFDNPEVFKSPKTYLQITNGHGGNVEGHDVEKQSEYNRLVYDDTSYGYGVLDIKNATHLIWTAFDALEDRVIDRIDLYQDFPRILSEKW